MRERGREKERETERVLSELVLGFGPQHFRQNQMMRKQKEHYLAHWKESTKDLGNMEHYLPLSQKYTVAEYLTTVTKTSLTKDRLSEHNLAIKKERPRQTQLSGEDRLCSDCRQNQLKTELHYLASCHTKTSGTHASNGLHRHARSLKMLTNCHIP